MADLNIIDRFLAQFSTYIDGGFGLLGGDVRSLSSLLVAIDVTLAGLFWALAEADDILAKFIRKILYVGSFAFILNHFSLLAQIIFQSFAQMGLVAGGNSLSQDDLLRPGKLAGTGYQAAWPLLDQASKLMGFASFFNNVVVISVLLIAWLLVIIAFFILAIQIFITILEFKLTTLAGFVLVPFALWNRSSFLAERVLGSVVSSGVKVMVLAVIIGIGSGFFVEFTDALAGHEPDIGQAMTLVLASLSILGLGIFGPGIASGLISGAPPLGAGSVMGTAALTAGGAMVGAGAIASVGGLAAAGLGAIRAGSGAGAGRGGAPAAPVGAASSAATTLPSAGSASSVATASPAGPTAAAPAWASRMQSRMRQRQARQTIIESIREGDGGGAGASPELHRGDE
jgi:type IV secretion system protein TrbL